MPLIRERIDKDALIGISEIREDAVQTVQALNHAVRASVRSLEQVKRQIEKHGRRDLADELTAIGESPQEMLAAYNAIRTMINTLDNKRDPGDLPS